MLRASSHVSAGASPEGRRNVGSELSGGSSIAEISPASFGCALGVEAVSTGKFVLFRRVPHHARSASAAPPRHINSDAFFGARIERSIVAGALAADEVP